MIEMISTLPLLAAGVVVGLKMNKIKEFIQDYYM